MSISPSGPTSVRFVKIVCALQGAGLCLGAATLLIRGMQLWSAAAGTASVEDDQLTALGLLLGAGLCAFVGCLVATGGWLFGSGGGRGRDCLFTGQVLILIFSAAIPRDLTHAARYGHLGVCLQVLSEILAVAVIIAANLRSARRACGRS